MGLRDWFKSTTFQGRIRHDLGSVKVRDGMLKHRIEVQELEPKSSERRFRLHIVSTAPLAWQSLPLVLNEQQTAELAQLLQAALAPDSSKGLHPARW